jgi:hypothetical protein
MTQIRLMGEQIAEMAIQKFRLEHPETQLKPEIPAPLKWAAGIISALFTMGVGAFCLWMVTTLNDMQITVARIDERQQSQSGDSDGKFSDFDRRITQLEAYHRGQAPK